MTHLSNATARLIRRKAVEGLLPADLDAAYYQSEAFENRMKFEGPAGLADQLAAAEWFLARCALDPRYAPGAALEQHGEVALPYFGIVNPVPCFVVPVGTPEHTALVARIKANLGSRMFRAAKAVQRIRARTPQRSDYFNTQVARISFSYPISQEERAATIAARCARRDVLVTRDHDRIYRLLGLATPGLHGMSWTDIVFAIARDVWRAPE